MDPGSEGTLPVLGDTNLAQIQSIYRARGFTNVFTNDNMSPITLAAAARALGTFTRSFGVLPEDLLPAQYRPQRLGSNFYQQLARLTHITDADTARRYLIAEVESRVSQRASRNKDLALSPNDVIRAIQQLGQDSDQDEPQQDGQPESQRNSRASDHDHDHDHDHGPFASTRHRLKRIRRNGRKRQSRIDPLQTLMDEAGRATDIGFTVTDPLGELHTAAATGTNPVTIDMGSVPYANQASAGADCGGMPVAVEPQTVSATDSEIVFGAVSPMTDGDYRLNLTSDTTTQSQASPALGVEATAMPGSIQVLLDSLTSAQDEISHIGDVMRIQNVRVAEAEQEVANLKEQLDRATKRLCQEKADRRTAKAALEEAFQNMKSRHLESITGIKQLFSQGYPGDDDT